MNVSKLIALVICFSFFKVANSQVTSVFFQLEYVDSTSHYNFNLVIGEGAAETFVHRVQFNATYSLIFPDNLNFTFVESLMPLENNQNYTGTIPINYGTLSTDDYLGDTYIALVPSLTPAAFYNNIYADDTITLFVFDMGGYNTNVRLLNSDTNETNINGSNYAQGFTMGSPSQLYSGNLPTSITGEEEEMEDTLFNVSPNYFSGNSPLLLGHTSGIPDSSSILTLESTTKGFLPPRMTASQREMIVDPTSGLIIYCTDCKEIQVYIDTEWKNMIGQPAQPPN